MRILKKCILFKVMSYLLLSLLSFELLAMEHIKCATTHYPPYTIFNPDTDSFSGLDMEIMNKLSNKLGIKTSVVNLPWVRLKEEIKKGNFDCYFSLGKFQHRERHLDYTTTPMHITKVAIFTRHNKAINQINFSNMEIGVHRGINLHKEVQLPLSMKSATFRKILSNEALFQMLLKNRLEAVITSYEVGKYLLDTSSAKNKYSAVVIDGYELPVYLAFTKGKFRIEKFNSALSSISKTP